MATQFAVDLLFKANTSKLKQATGETKKVEQAVDKLNGRLRDSKGRFIGAGQGAGQAANGIRGFGRAATGAAGGVRTLGAAIQAALGPLAIAGGAVGALTAAFQTLSQQDFAEAKVRSLGTNSEELVGQLRQVSAELKGQASVVELTGAAYDVASAGFVKAADAAKVLKAASLGATGGFSDINTVGNAATSVLNAYGLSADHAAGLVDKFIQTQNDGKIIVAEYAANIGKVASAAAGLGIPLSEVNAVISQATASGVQAEIAFTGLKGALARLASGEAGKALEEYGININAATIEADGLLGTLKKLEGLDTGTLFKALGTEAGPALLPVIQNLERFEELIAKQEGSAGAAARAQAEAANTIQGAWKALQTEFSNFFSEQSALGDVLKVTLFGLAEAVKIFAQSVNFLLAPFKAIVEAAFQVASALDQAFGITEKIEQVKTSFTQFGTALKGIFGDLATTVSNVWSGFIDELGVALGPLREQWNQFTQNVANVWNETTTVLTQYWDLTVSQISEAATGLGNWIQGVWGSISQGAQGIIQPIGDAFKAAFDYAKSIIDGFWNSLPNWLKGALSAASSVVGGVANAVGTALNSVKGEIGKAIQGSGRPAPAGGTGTIPKTELPKTPTTPTGGGGGGGGKSKAKKQSDELKKQQQELKRIQDAYDRIFESLDKSGVALNSQLEDQQRLNALLMEGFDSKAAEKQVAFERQIKDLQLERAGKLQELKGIEGITLQQTQTGEADINRIYDERIQKAFELNQAKERGNQLLDAAAAKSREIQAQEQMLQNLYDGIGSTIANGIGSAIDAVASGTEDLGKTLEDLGRQILAQVGKMLIFYALAQAFGALAGGAGGSGSGLFGALAKGFGFEFGGRASGGPVTPGGSYVVGENGPELLQMSPSGGGYVHSNPSQAMSRYRPGSSGSAAAGGADGGADGGAAGQTVNVAYTVERINERNYVTEEAFRAGMNQAAKRGAEGGYTKTMSSMRNSRSTRARIGMG